MKIDLIVIGKTNIDFVTAGTEEYTKRLKRYIKFNIVVVSDIKGAKNMNFNEIKQREGEALLPILAEYDYIVLLDEKGKNPSSEEFALWIEQKSIQSIKRLCFVVGGAYGFSDEIYSKSKEKISISRMTFSHQMIRLLFTEQLYRAFTIIKDEPYHHK